MSITLPTLQAHGVPKGAILMWSGAITDIPYGWALCDGSNGTPNLTDRFVIHADADSGGTNDVGDTGGSHSVSLTTAQLPAHNHGLDFGDGNFATDGARVKKCYSGSNSGTKNNWISNTGSGSSHENRPKFYALAFIMKTIEIE